MAPPIPAIQSKDAPKQNPAQKPDAKQEANTKPEAKPEQLDRFGRKLHPSASPQEASKPDADGLAPQGEGGRPGRDAKRLAHPGQPPEGAKPEDGQTPAQAAIDSRSGGKQKLGRRGKPGPEEPKADEAKGNAAKDDAGKSETAKTETGKTEDKPESSHQACRRGQAGSGQIRYREGRCAEGKHRAEAPAPGSGSGGNTGACRWIRDDCQRHA